ncbi:MAG: hypothetical protein JNM56_03370, partial [Planctomycetia bacterium]|nr:hypothetical protein [Planctomycetia bacterium]
MRICTRSVIRQTLAVCFLVIGSLGLAPSSAQQSAPAVQKLEAARKLILNLRTRIDYAGDGSRWHVLYRQTEWNPKQTAVVICDMWDKHWCACSTKRVGEMAPRMNEVVSALREKGALIIHCPSDTMEFY